MGAGAAWCLGLGFGESSEPCCEAVPVPQGAVLQRGASPGVGCPQLLAVSARFLAVLWLVFAGGRRDFLRV